FPRRYLRCDRSTHQPVASFATPPSNLVDDPRQRVTSQLSDPHDLKRFVDAGSLHPMVRQPTLDNVTRRKGSNIMGKHFVLLALSALLVSGQNSPAPLT